LRNYQIGFSLLEVLFAFMIISTVIYLSLGFLHNQLKSTINAYERSVAVNELASLAENILIWHDERQFSQAYEHWQIGLLLSNAIASVKVTSTSKQLQLCWYDSSTIMNSQAANKNSKPGNTNNSNINKSNKKNNIKCAQLIMINN